MFNRGKTRFARLFGMGVRSRGRRAVVRNSLEKRSELLLPSVGPTDAAAGRERAERQVFGNVIPIIVRRGIHGMVVCLVWRRRTEKRQGRGADVVMNSASDSGAVPDERAGRQARY